MRHILYPHPEVLPHNLGREKHQKKTQSCSYLIVHMREYRMIKDDLNRHLQNERTCKSKSLMGLILLLGRWVGLEEYQGQTPFLASRLEALHRH